MNQQYNFQGWALTTPGLTLDQRAAIIEQRVDQEIQHAQVSFKYKESALLLKQEQNQVEQLYLMPDYPVNPQVYFARLDRIIAKIANFNRLVKKYSMNSSMTL